MTTKLEAAVEVFRQLGWEQASLENILSLPIGTPEQKKIALAGLKSGEWGHFVTTNDRNYHWQSLVDVDKNLLALFATRVGVTPQRAVKLLPHADKELVLKVIAQRGSKYEVNFIKAACTSSHRFSEHAGSVFSSVALRLVEQLGLEIPQNADYIKDWSVYAAIAMGLWAERNYRETWQPSLEQVKEEFITHIQIGIAMNVPVTGPFGEVFAAGEKQGWLNRDVAIELAFSALDKAVRPGDRKVWLSILNELAVSDAELALRIQASIPLLALGDNTLITQLAPRLIELADKKILMEVLLAAFSATTKKAKKIVLSSALKRSRPENAEELTPWLAMFISDTDKKIVGLATQLIEEWRLTVTAYEETAEIQGLWQETPAIWQVPAFELGEISGAALTELAAKLVQRPAMVHDALMEQFLALSNKVAYQDEALARSSLQGLRQGTNPGILYNITQWLNGEQPQYVFDTATEIKPPLIARDYSVVLHLGKLPCLLSTPSNVDLSISLTDLIERLQLYKRLELDVLEADLYLALTRLDTKVESLEAFESLAALTIPIMLQSGKKMVVTAGQAVLTYLENPIAEPQILMDDRYSWKREDILTADALPDFPKRLAYWYTPELSSVFPRWGDVALKSIRWNQEVSHEQGLVLRQAARRVTPLPAGASINFLASQRSMSPDAAADSMLAVTEVWERGLLRPGIADVALLDWTTSSPANVASLAAAFETIAQGGMLSVIWPILDDLVGAALQAPRLIVGTAEIVELLVLFLPEVQEAIQKGLTNEQSLYLLHTRKLAERSGSSRGIILAQQIVSLLPEVKVPAKEEETALKLAPPFDELWPAEIPASSILEDHVDISVDWAESPTATKPFLFTLQLPDISDRVFYVVNRGWYYDLEREGQCQAYAAKKDTPFNRSKENEVWLHWDMKQKALTVWDDRNWTEKTTGPLRNTKVPPLSASLLTVVIGLLAQDGHVLYFAPRLLNQFINTGELGVEMVRRATKTLLKSPVVSPAKLVRVLEKDEKLLYVLWPMLVESIKVAGKQTVASGKIPIWVNRVLDVAIRYSPYLAEAANRGLIPAEDARWLGLEELIAVKTKPVATTKAKKLLVLLDLK